MNFPKGIRRCEAPRRTNHRGRTWDAWDLILPDGTIINGFLDTTWGTRFYFQIDGVWRCGAIADFEQGRQHTAWFDLRDQKALAAVELKIAAYEMALRGEDKALVERLCEEVEQMATAAGFNDHRRLAALHTWAERIGA